MLEATTRRRNRHMKRSLRNGLRSDALGEGRMPERWSWDSQSKVGYKRNMI